MQPAQLPQRARAFNRIITGSLIFASLFALLGFVQLIIAMLTKESQIDFAAYYVAGRVLNAGVPLYHFDTLDRAALGIANIKYTDYVYPPFLAVLLRPLAWLPYRAAELTWLACNVALYVGNCVLVARLLRMPWPANVLLVCCGLLLPAVYDTMLLGQIGLLINLLMLGALYSLFRLDRSLASDVVAGVLFGLAVAIKIYPAVFGLWLLAERRYRVLLVALATVAVAFGIGVVAGGGWRTTREWFLVVTPMISGRLSFPSNQSIRAVLERLLNESAFPLPVPGSDAGVMVHLHPVAVNPPLGALLGSLLTLCCALVTMWRLFFTFPAANEITSLLRASLVLTLMLLVTPVTWDMYYVHLLLPLALLAYQARHNRPLQSPLLLACLLIAIQHYWAYMVLRVPSALLTLFGFAGVFALWLLLLRVTSMLTYTPRPSSSE